MCFVVAHIFLCCFFFSYNYLSVVFFSLSQVCENVSLPRLNIDDFIIFENMGAYTIPIASPFNGFPLPKIEYYVERKHL